jgi:hypothetical protein
MPTIPCDACGREFDLRAESCPRCGFPRDGATTLLDPIGGKKPRMAMWLSVGWPGAGHLYAGRTQDGAILSFVSLVIMILSSWIISPVLGLLIWSAVALYAAIDSSRAITGSRGR